MPSLAPTLSVVLAAPHGLDSVRRTLDRLHAQTVRERLEVIVVTDGEVAGDDVRQALDAFAARRVVRLPSLESRAAANAEGCRHAHAEVVAFAEDHCFPDARWAETLLVRHAGPWAAVGPAIENANPGSAVSWCDLLINYGPWIGPEAGPAPSLPGHNTSYKRAVLSRYGSELAAWLEVEAELHDDMIRRGESLFVDPAARVSHLNISRWFAWLPALFFGGQIYAAARCRDWPLSRRLVYAAAWPLIPLVRLGRMLASWPPGAPSRARLAFVLLAGLVADGAGQALGYLAGRGQSARRMARYEFERSEHVRAAERYTTTQGATQ
jgi:hypothetical protein